MLYRRGKCDFPWAYANRCPHSKTRFGGGVHGQYPTISDKEALDDWAPWIDSLFHPKEAVLFLWVTWPKMPFWSQFIKACGFEYSACGFVWVKTYTPKNHQYFQGTGFYTASNSEACLILTRKGAKLKPQRKLLPEPFQTLLEIEDDGETVISPRLGHSEKPMEFTRRIDLMFPASLYGQGIGLFERAPQGDTWDVFGNEVEGSIPGPDFKPLKLNLEGIS